MKTIQLQSILGQKLRQRSKAFVQQTKERAQKEYLQRKSAEVWKKEY